MQQPGVKAQQADVNILKTTALFIQNGKIITDISNLLWTRFCSLLILYFRQYASFHLLFHITIWQKDSYHWPLQATAGTRRLDTKPRNKCRKLNIIHTVFYISKKEKISSDDIKPTSPINISIDWFTTMWSIITSYNNKDHFNLII